MSGMSSLVSGILELPGQIQNSELHVFTDHADQAHSLPSLIGWMNGETLVLLVLPIADQDFQLLGFITGR